MKDYYQIFINSHRFGNVDGAGVQVAVATAEAAAGYPSSANCATHSL